MTLTVGLLFLTTECNLDAGKVMFLSECSALRQLEKGEEEQKRKLPKKRGSWLPRLLITCCSWLPETPTLPIERGIGEISLCDPMLSESHTRSM